MKAEAVPFYGILVAALVIERASLSLLAGPQLTGQGLNLDEQVLLPRVAEDARAFFLASAPWLNAVSKAALS